MFRLAGTKLNKSTAYHPQFDGQTEVVNRGLETYLRCFCSEKPKEWVSWLSWVEFWYNTTFQRTLGVSSFQVVYGRKPPSLLSYGEGETSNSTLDEQFRERDVILVALREHLILAQQQMKQYADCKRRKLKKLVGDHTGVQPTIQYINENLEWQAQPEDILEYWKNKADGWEVLICWKGFPRHEASWEDYDEIHQLYPDLHLEDKILLDVVSVFNMVSSISKKKQVAAINQEGIQFYPTNDEFVLLECIWEVDKFILKEKIQEVATKNQEHIGPDVSLATSAMRYRKLQSFFGGDESEEGEANQSNEKGLDLMETTKNGLLTSPSGRVNDISMEDNTEAKDGLISLVKISSKTFLPQEGSSLVNLSSPCPVQRNQT
ncbi:pleiotropic drug resistance protein 1-like [Cucumis melo var. makuwa]|uniref:Pleiotropic drug resistance protein 1-like n=1 Tax=Cucumis melo var. makuwa TaxID=1194695 RepID=A0A5D3BVI1_CUCMM|nr:pleiotropic drug resistance protein 1-like [Cucumis melo var. makuwa]